MLNSLTGLFHTPRSRETGKLRFARARRDSRRRQGDSLTLQSLESRLALSVSTTATSLNSDGSQFAWNILIGDAQDATGGRDWYFQQLPTGGALLADNPGFQNAKTLGLNFSSSTCTTIYVASGGNQTSTFASITPSFIGTYDYSLPSANPLGVSGTVSIGGGLSFTYAVDGLTYRTGSSFATLTITPNDSAAWTTAGFGTPTGTISTVGGVSTLEFRTVDSASPAAPINLPQFDLSNFSYQYFSAAGNPQSFTVSPGQNFSQRLIVDLAPVGSSVSINSPWQASLGNAATEGAEVFYSTYSNPTAAGNVCLFASTVNIEQSITTTSQFTIGGQTQANPARYRKSGSNTPTVALNVNAVMQAPRYDLELTGSATSHANLAMSQAGSFVGASATTAAGSLTLIGDYTDVQYLGLVAAAQQSYLLRAAASADQYQFTTRSSATGAQAGTIAGGTVALTLGQPAGGTVDLRTDVSNLRFDSGIDASSVPYAYTVTIEEANDLTVDAVGSSSAPISIRSGVTAGTGDLTILGSAVRTVSDLSLSTPGTLTLSGAVTTGDGDIRISAASLAVSTNIAAGGNRSVNLNSTVGAASVSSLVQAGGQVKETVRVATTGTITLSGTQTVDGVALVVGNRVLVKNQTTASQNGIYVVAAGAWTRASDANTASLLVPGFVTFAAEGSQKGGWTFRNAATPIVGSTGLSFVPTTATVVFNPVRLATTGENLALDGIGQTIDGQTVVAGNRILAKDQTDPSDNGIYVASAGAWTRASDADTVAELRSGAFAFITSGTVNGTKGFALANDAVEVGTTPLTFADFVVASPRTNIWSPANVLANADVATVNNIALSGLQTIDGVLLTAGNRVLVKNQAKVAENGLYVAAATSWDRATDAATAADLPGATTVFVKNGTQNKNTAWNIDNSITETATTVKDSAVVSSLFSTQALSVGMLVVGAGIPANTTIAAINADGHSVRLSANATLPGTNTAVSFLSTSAITLGTSPIRFLPVGGDVAVTSATDITGASRMQGSTAVLTAGAAGTSGIINAATNVGELIASALGSITLDNAAPVELTNVRTTAAGSITATSKGTLTATLVSAAGTTGTPGNLSLTSQFGDVVAGNVSSTFGDISLVASNKNVLITTGTSTPANVTAQAGNVAVTADFGTIKVDGRVQAQGVGSDVTLSSANGTMDFTDLANVSATDQFTISAPSGMPTVATNAQLAAAALNYTAKFGSSSSPPTSLGSYATVTLTRTDAGDIDYTVPGSLTVAGASTNNGSITFKAAALTVTGAIAPNGTAKDVSLTADSGDILIDNTITTGGNLVLSAAAGNIGGTSGTTAKLTVTSDITLTALSSAQLSTKAGGLNATLTGANAVLVVTEDDSLDIKSVVFDGTGATATLTVGSAALGGVAKVGLISAGTTGTVTINANSNILENTVDAAADIVAQTLFLTSTTGSIDLDTDVAVLSATTQQAGKSLSIRDVGTGAAAGLELKSIVAAGTVTVTSVGAILATSVTNNGAVSLTTTGVDADILLGSVVATGNTATLHAARSILEVTAGDTLADLVAAGTVLTADTGSINVQTNVDSLAATATTVGSSITVSEDNALSIGVASQGINGQTVSITTGALGGNGAMTQSQSVVATQGLTVTNLGNAGAVTLGNAANDVASVAITNTGRAVTYTDKNGFDIATAGIVGSTVALTAAGNVTQTGAIAATTLTVTNSAGTVVLGNVANNADSIALSNTGRAITYTDSNGFDIAAAGIVGSTATLSAGGNVTQSGAITAASLAVTNSAGTVTLGNVSNDVASVAITNTGRAITYTDKNGFDVAGITGSTVAITAAGTVTQSAAITATVLAVTNTTGSVTLDNLGNSVGTLGTVSNPGGDVTFVNAGTFATTAITAGTIAVGDGDILLKSVNGSINVNGDLTAQNDRVTLDARNGTFTLANGITIDAYMLAYYVATPPTFGVGTTIPSIVAANGNLTIDSLTPVTFGGYTTEGDITIIGTTVTISGLLKTTGTGKTVAITATAGDIAFISAGAIDNAVGLSGTTTLSAAAGTITGSSSSAVSGFITTLTVGQALSFAGPITATTLTATGANTGISLTGTNSLGTVAVTKGSNVVINDSTGTLILGAISATGSITVTAAGVTASGTTGITPVAFKLH